MRAIRTPAGVRAPEKSWKAHRPVRSPRDPDPVDATDRTVNPVWALSVGRYAVLATGFVVAAVATPFAGTQLVLSAVGLVWVGVTAGHAGRASRAGRSDARAWSSRPVVPVGDAVFVLAVVAATGGAESPMRWLMIAAPAIWATSRQPHVAVLGGFGALGYLVASARDLAELDSETVRTVAGFLAIYLGATVASEASSRARQRETELRQAVAEERRSVHLRLLEQARRQRETLILQLHDGPLQTVIVARQDLEDATADDLDLDALRRDLDDAVDEMRTLTTDMYDAVLRDEDLAEALAGFGREIDRRGGPTVRVSVGDGCAGVHDGLVLRTVRELLSNVEKHAHASTASVVVGVEGDPDRLRVVVSDDGIGIGAGRRRDARSEGHVGLASVQRAVDAVGGELLVVEHSSGTEIRVDLPHRRRS